jgi:hypothetical protein
MTLHILVEGPSERAFLEPWAARLLHGHPVRVHPHQGKGKLPTDMTARPEPKRRGLLDQLPATLRGFAKSLDPKKDGVVVLVDADEDDAQNLASRIQRLATACCGAVRVSVTLAIEETEAFYLGDLRALERAFPDADLRRARAYVPDSIVATWELFGEIVHDGGGNKVAWAEAMGKVVTVQPGRNRSPSFNDLLRALLALLPVPTVRKRKVGRRHPVRKHIDSGRRR